MAESVDLKAQTRDKIEHLGWLCRQAVRAIDEGKPWDFRTRLEQVLHAADEVGEILSGLAVETGAKH